MERQLWAPWRISYILGPKPDECVFCIPDTEEEDEERLILHRGKNCFVIMNKYPYNNGHIMVCPYRHVMDLGDLDADTIHEIMDYLQFCTKVLKANFHCPGINIGLNMGEAGRRRHTRAPAFPSRPALERRFLLPCRHGWRTDHASVPERHVRGFKAIL